ncbi:hypothetical protein Taro_039945 [Colocasia esculenta]|uniref:Uncharacterized protein n=1 Tax=Colocasia esculenta TaxID=4460 RepID=A0A843WX44_COLES|nr:hypothetical protein [Colocasia esculenta]
MDYDPVWKRRDYWESLCHRWASRPWQERSQAAKRNQVAHLKQNVHTSGSGTYDRTMADRYAEGTLCRHLILAYKSNHYSCSLNEPQVGHSS